MTVEADAVISVAGLMALAARTAPKAVGIDSVKIEVLTGKEQEKLADAMVTGAKETGFDFFRINGEQVRVSDATLLIGVEGQKTLGINCGGCGHASCAEMAKAVVAGKNKGALYPGPNCVFKISDLGIAVGSAVKTAAIHNVDNRIMFTAGEVAMKLGHLKGCSVAYGIPLKASGKNIYFDVPMHEH
ncbi:ferredoxin domain-containing protein [Methanoregula sp.]|uniref:ferredoxin domain-containing protein n=1 Tax=Methanoregula sp. TaxID=2052170 RepID=UPI003C784C6A